MEPLDLNISQREQIYFAQKVQGKIINFRKKLEDSGVILFKDASTNKGGVTSSSYEVQAAMSFKDEEFWP